MSMDLHRVVNIVRDDLKKTYAMDPSVIWDNPVIFISQSGGKAGYLKPDAQADLTREEEEKFLIEWMKQFKNDRSIEAVVVGRMMVQYSGVVNPNGEKMISKRAIVVSGRSFIDGGTRVSITEVKEHRDYRSPEAIATEAMPLNPGLEAPDATKLIMSGDKIVGILTGQFQPEQVMDSRDGVKCMVDPLIQGIVGIDKTAGVI